MSMNNWPLLIIYDDKYGLILFSLNKYTKKERLKHQL